MKQSCNIIKDLLILYEDGACSADSVQVIEEHLRTCPECSKHLKRLQCTDEIISEEIKEELLMEDKVMKKNLKKIRKRWAASILAVFLLIPCLGLGLMVYHEVCGEGIAYSNIDDIYRCIRYLKYIEDGKFEKAAEMVDFSQNEYRLVESVAHMTLEEYEEYMKERMINKLQEYDELGIYIDNISYSCSYRVNEGQWNICVSLDENYPDGSEQRIEVQMNSETMYVCAYSYPDFGSVNRDDYIDEILHLYSEDDPLGYQDMEVTFVLQEGEQAIINWTEEASDQLDLLDVGLFNISYGTGTPLIKEPFFQDSFITSVPGEYSICGIASQGERVYLTKDDIDIKIAEYE